MFRPARFSSPQYRQFGAALSAGGNGHGTASALEYAVKALKVPHLIIMGHSACGGVQACYEMCENNVAAEDAGFEFVGHWLETLRPAHGRISGTEESARLISMGHQGVIGSLDNLMGYPFVAEAVEAGELSLHGLWHDIGPGALYALNPKAARLRRSSGKKRATHWRAVLASRFYNFDGLVQDIVHCRGSASKK